MTDKTEATETEAPSLRQMVKDSSQEDFAKAHSKDSLEAMAAFVDATVHGKGTKADLTTAIYLKFPAADPALRGKSREANPVACVWAAAHNMFTEAHGDDGDDTREFVKPRRKDVVKACVDAGIAFYTARTQYQAWFKFTTGGENMIQQDTTGLPKGLAEMLGFAVVPEPKEADAS